MQSPDFTSFFVASAGAGAALVGLLFVAISVNPERNAGPSAPPFEVHHAAGLDSFSIHHPSGGRCRCNRLRRRFDE